MLKGYCASNGLRTDDTSAATHLFMDGGKLVLTKEKSEHFWKTYKNMILSNTSICLVERSNAEKCRFFLDIDLKGRPFDIDAFAQRASIDFPDAVYVVCFRRNEHTIFGVHVIFHSLTYASVAEAKSIAKRFAWVDGIDESVYSTGLRMIGSVKPQQTPREDTMYLPAYKVYGTTIKKVPKSISRRAVDETSIRLSYANRKDEASEKKMVCIPCAEDLVPETVLLHKNYKDCVTHIQHYKDGYFVANTNSRYCLNTGDEHASAHVYFVIHPKTRMMFQKCFCRCADKTCKTFKSKGVKLSLRTCELVLLQQHTQ
jgi:hypothetical protein